MSRIINRAEAWETTYSAFQQINFTSYDFETIKQSMLDYIKLYFPEQFNDYIESSEFIAVLELFAYLGELIAYRVDMNAHENFLPTAQRKQSVLRLAKLISYSASRNIPARGLVKLTTVSTTENVYDSDGINLANTIITWNDPSNSKWKEQFLLVMNKILAQSFGTVSPNDRVQVDDVLFELYQLNNTTTTIPQGVVPYTITVSGDTIPMELVPSSLNENGPYERRPELNNPFTILYANDGLGDGSSSTGFFCFTKQGTLQLFTSVFDGLTPNQIASISVNNINETDVWVNNVDPDTLEILDDGSVPNGRSGEWQQVDIANAQNIIFNTNENRNKYEIETQDNDKIRIIFGDGEFSNIPSGTFHFWVRSSANIDNLVIPAPTISNKAATFTYLDVDNIVRNFGFTFSQVATIQNASPSEDIENIRRVAPSVYYSQDRMVNGRDYNTFLLQDPSILKIRAVNRTFAGEAKYIPWNDPSGTYDNVKVFGDDLALYYKSEWITKLIPSAKTAPTLLSEDIEPLLSSLDVFGALISTLPSNDPPPRTFSATETNYILNGGGPLSGIFLGLNSLVGGSSAYIVYDNFGGGIFWDVTDVSTTPNIIFKVTLSPASDSWTIEYLTAMMVGESQDTNFWNINEPTGAVTYDTLNSNLDRLVVLKANTNRDRTTALTDNLSLIAVSQVAHDVGLPNQGLPNIHQLQVTTSDTTSDLIPDNFGLPSLLDPQVTTTTIGTVTLPISYVNGQNDVTFLVGTGTEDGAVGDVVNTVTVTTAPATIQVKDYVYFARPTTDDPFVPVSTTDTNIEEWLADTSGDLHKRERGRSDLNFLWQHIAVDNNVIDPAASNIIDVFVVTRGYYTSFKNWVDGSTSIKPDAPTPYQLRSDYASLLDNKMISDTMVLRPVQFKVLFGAKAAPTLQCMFKVVRSSSRRLTDNQIKVKVVAAIKNFFDISRWEFGETFYFTEAAAEVHNQLLGEIDSIVLVPLQTNSVFGDLFEVQARENELFIPDVTVGDIEIVQSYNAQNIRQ